MSSARIPPSRCSHKNASQPNPSCWYGRSRARSPGGGAVGLGDLGRQQALDLLAPRRRLMSDHAQRGQLVPEPGLVPADPQLAGRRVLQRPGLLDQPGERPQLGLVQGEIGPVGQQEMWLAAAERQEHLEERNRVPLYGDGHAQVEPVGLAGQLIGGHRDLQRVPGLPVVRGLAADLEDQPGLISQQRQQLGA